MRGFREALVDNDILVGMIALVVAIAAVISVGTMYLRPPNRATVSFTTRDAAAIAAGDDVRIAGISVGKVSDVSLRDHNVHVTLDVDREVRVGDRSRVKVQLLTAVGGYYVSLVPSGVVTRDSDVIPPNRVTVPYTVADILQELPRVTDNVDGVPIERGLAQVSDGLSQNAVAVRNAVSGLQAIAGIVDKQKGQVRSVLDMASNYLATFNSSRAYLSELVRKLNIVLSQYYTYRVRFTEAYRQLGSVLERIGTLARFYLNHSDELYPSVAAARDLAHRVGDSIGGAIDNLEPLRQQLLRLIGPDGTGLTDGTFIVDAAGMCLPMEGKTC